MSDKFVSSEVDRGTYLVEALSHCAECHSPRNILGALKFSEWLEGAQDPSGKEEFLVLAPRSLLGRKMKL